MSIKLPNNKAEKLARYNMLVKQGSLTIEQAKQYYREYLNRLKRIYSINTKCSQAYKDYLLRLRK